LKIVILFLIILSIITIPIIFSRYLLEQSQKHTLQSRADVGPKGSGGHSLSSGGYTSSGGKSSKSSRDGGEGGGGGGGGRGIGGSGQGGGFFSNDFLNKERAATNNKDNVSNVTEKNGYYKNSDGSYSYDPNKDLRNPGSSNNGITTPATCSFGGNGSGGCGRATKEQWGLKDQNGKAVTDNNGDGKIDQKDCSGSCSVGIIKDNPNSPYAAGVGGEGGVRNNDVIKQQIDKTAAASYAKRQANYEAAVKAVELAQKNLDLIKEQIKNNTIPDSLKEINLKRAEEVLNQAKTKEQEAKEQANKAKIDADLAIFNNQNFLFLDSKTASVSSFASNQALSAKTNYILGNPKNNDDYIYRCYRIKNQSQLKCNSYSELIITTDTINYCCFKN